MTEAERERNLKEVAKALMRENRAYFGTFPIDVLTTWLSERGPNHSVVCVYCGTPLIADSSDSFCNATADHLLPKATYPWLGFDVDSRNSVPCCYPCNNVKSHWDPNEKDPVYIQGRDPDQLGKNQRKILIERVREFLREKRKTKHSPAWESWVKACEKLDELDDHP